MLDYDALDFWKMEVDGGEYMQHERLFKMLSEANAYGVSIDY